MPLDGDTNQMRWVFFGASGIYLAGKFDGEKFTPETQPQRLQNGNCWYAAQVYSDIPASDGRCTLVPWGRLPDGEIFRGMTFNQMMGLPVELTLQSTSSGPRLEANPVRELASLRTQTHEISPQPFAPGHNPLAGIQGDLFEIEAEITIGTAQKISCLGNQAVLAPENGKISLHIFADRARWTFMAEAENFICRWRKCYCQRIEACNFPARAAMRPSYP